MSELPKSWVNCQLENCVEILDSQRKPINNRERQSRIEGKNNSELYPYYGATGKVGLIDDFLFNGEFVALGEDGVPFFDPLKHKAYILKGKTWVNNHAHVISGSNGINNNFLCYFLNQMDYHGFVNGATRLKLTQANMRKLPIKLPPLNEQIRIANKLDALLAKVDAVQARLDKIPTLLKRFRQAVLAAATSGELTKEWRERKQREYSFKEYIFDDLLVELRNGLSPKPNQEGKGSAILRISSVRSGVVDQSDIRHLECEEKTIDKYKLKAGDLLFTRYNGSIDFVGVCGLIRELKYNVLVYPDKLIRARLNNIAIPEFIEIYFSSAKARKNLTDCIKSTSGQKGVSGKDIKAQKVIIPSLEEQVEIVRRVELFFTLADSVEKQYKAMRKNTDRLTQSLLAKAFRGELVPQDPNDEPAEKLLKKIVTAREASLVSKSKAAKITKKLRSKL